MSISRRELIKGLSLTAAILVVAPSCTRHRYVRPAGELDLGTLRELLYEEVHVRPKAAYVVRDATGWAVLSTRCTYKGCDLTKHDNHLFCPCCLSRFRLTGEVMMGPAPDPLPWMKPRFQDGHLYADPGDIVTPSYRFTTEEIEQAITQLRQRIKEEGVQDEVIVPEILMGKGEDQEGIMFVEDDPNRLYDLDMIK